MVEEAELCACGRRARDQSIVIRTCGSLALVSCCLRGDVLRPSVYLACSWIEIRRPQYIVYSIVLLCLVSAIYQAFATVICRGVVVVGLWNRFARFLVGRGWQEMCFADPGALLRGKDDTDCVVVGW